MTPADLAFGLALAIGAATATALAIIAWPAVQAIAHLAEPDHYD